MLKSSNWPGVALLALGTFIIGTDAHSVTGLLPQMADSLHASVAEVAQSVTVFAIAYAVFSPILTGVLRVRGEQFTLALGLVVFTVGNAASAVAPGVPLLLVARVVAAAGAAIFTPTAGAAAVALVAPERRGTALALVTAGSSTALVLGAPAGAWIASAASWRLTLGLIALLGLLTLPVVLFVPTRPTPGAEPLAQRFAVLALPGVRRTLGISLLGFAGVFIPYTYLSQAYAPLIQVLPGGIGFALMLFGVTSVIGALTSGPLADRVPARWVVVAATAGLAVVNLTAVLGQGMPVLLALLLLTAGYLSWSILAPQQHQLVALAPESAAVLISANASAAYLGISLAGIVGGLALELAGPARFALVATILLLLAAGWRALPIPAVPTRVP